jgi:hypothetical protein
MTTESQKSFPMDYSIWDKVTRIIFSAIEVSERRDARLLSTIFEMLLKSDKSEEPSKKPKWLQNLSTIITLFYCVLLLIASRKFFVQHHQKTNQSITFKPRLIKPQFSTAPPKI